MNAYLSGQKLYGDDFEIDQIRKWYEDETEAYANLNKKKKINSVKQPYGYHELNKLHGFSKIKTDHFSNVLGFGSAFGFEFEPIIDRISRLTIVEPSDKLISSSIGGLVPNYVKPQVDGKLSFPDNTFDLITSFGTLHHIPNVSSVLTELTRVLQPGGYMLIREPITSMGDWNSNRRGLTKHERGIPAAIFENIFRKEGLELVSKRYCMTLTAFFQRTIRRYLKHPVYSYRFYILFDKVMSALLKSNWSYHAKTSIGRLRPTNIFYVVRKPLN